MSEPKCKDCWDTEFGVAYCQKHIPLSAEIEDAIEAWGNELDNDGEPRLVGMAPGFRRGAKWGMTKFEEENSRLKALLKDIEINLTDDGYNSVRETVALMAEGEGSDTEVYRTMAKRVLVALDIVISKLKSEVGE